MEAGSYLHCHPIQEGSEVEEEVSKESLLLIPRTSTSYFFIPISPFSIAKCVNSSVILLQVFKCVTEVILPSSPIITSRQVVSTFSTPFTGVVHCTLEWSLPSLNHNHLRVIAITIKTITLMHYLMVGLCTVCYIGRWDMSWWVTWNYISNDSSCWTPATDKIGFSGCHLWSVRHKTSEGIPW